MSSTNKLRLLGLSAAVAAGFALQPASAQIGDPNLTSASIVNLNTSTGTAVVIPYYTVKAGWQTLINVTNTTTSSLAVKFRMYEGRNSRDVMDFNIGLSPKDVWTATISLGTDGRPFLQTADRSCTSPASVRTNGLAANEFAYSTFGANTSRDHDATDGDVTRMQEGYIELLVMGETSVNFGQGDAPTATVRGDTAYQAVHVSGEPRNCTQWDNDFLDNFVSFTANDAVGGVTIPGQEGSGDPLARDLDGQVAGDNVTGATPNDRYGYGVITSTKPLRVNASLINTAGGIASNVQSMHVANYGVGENLVTAQQFPYFLEPTLASGEGIWTTNGLAELEYGISARNVSNEWTENRTDPGVDADAEWILTFPTKRFHVDEDSQNIQASCNQYRNAAHDGVGGPGTDPGLAVGGGGTNWPGFTAVSALPNRPTQLLAPQVCPSTTAFGVQVANFPNKFQNGNTGTSNIGVEYTLYDREEREEIIASDTTTPSPFPPGVITPDNLPFEANVIKIGANARTRTSKLGTANALAVPTGTALPGAEAGWMNLGFTESDFLPVAGFLIKVRDFGDPTRNTAQGNDHAFNRGFVQSK